MIEIPFLRRCSPVYLYIYNVSLFCSHVLFVVVVVSLLQMLGLVYKARKSSAHACVFAYTPLDFASFILELIFVCLFGLVCSSLK